jgi:hypothetical protein
MTPELTSLFSLNNNMSKLWKMNQFHQSQYIPYADGFQAQGHITRKRCRAKHYHGSHRYPVFEISQLTPTPRQPMLESTDKPLKLHPLKAITVTPPFNTFFTFIMLWPDLTDTSLWRMKVHGLLPLRADKTVLVHSLAPATEIKSLMQPKLPSVTWRPDLSNPDPNPKIKIPDMGIKFFGMKCPLSLQNTQHIPCLLRSVSTSPSESEVLCLRLLL